MAQIYLCFLWHMHQPFYKDLLTGEYRLPWARLHALKDYYGMVKILDEFPGMRQTFNLVPSLVLQVEDYARNEVHDPFWSAAMTPAENLSEEQRQFMLQYFFQANREHMIHRYPRYRELYEQWEGSGMDPGRATHYFSTQDYRDLQVLSQLAWFDEEFLEHDAEVKALVERVSDYRLEDQKTVARKEREILNAVLEAYRSAAVRGQIEISTTPFYHPILPLLCDTDVGAEAHPGLPLPRRFRRPEDAREQLRRARDFIEQRFGRRPVGLWPSEGSVSNEALALAAENEFQWAATDQGVLEKTLHMATTGPGGALYRPYLWERDGHRLSLLFRDHFLSDLIGFVFSRMGPEEAAEDFARRLAAIGEPFLASGRDALIPIILDGENAWEYYDRNGRPFLRALYRRIQSDQRFRAVTVSEAINRLPAEPLHTIAPGSWINANFDIWIGAEEDNRAWNLLWEARQFFDRACPAPGAATAAASAAPAGSCSAEARELAYQELLIAEGSDWCWWYGPEHDTANRIEFDELFRNHLSNIYRALDSQPPEELAQPILHARGSALSVGPTGYVRPIIDGEISTYFEWIGAGLYRANQRLGAMHGKRFLVQELHYGTDGASFFLRVDFLPGVQEHLPGIEARLTLQLQALARISLRLSEGGVEVSEVAITDGDTAAQPSDRKQLEARLGRILEVRVPLDLLPHDGGKLRFQFSLWQEGLPIDALPTEGWIEMDLAEPGDWMV
ncbi:MAG TPA: glycoside hydrolase family 57 protein [Bryobacterales bacterium]|nr:glycoside hydrolase family 57 protein [Bryobacterales bacterium]